MSERDRFDAEADVLVQTLTARDVELDPQPFIDRVAAALRAADAAAVERCIAAASEARAVWERQRDTAEINGRDDDAYMHAREADAIGDAINRIRARGK